MSPPIDRRVCLAVAANVLTRPPARPWIERYPPRGELVACFALPLDLCHPQNTDQRHRPEWAHSADRKQLLGVMSVQLRHQLPRDRYGFTLAGGRALIHYAAPLPGRPQVRAIRFSSVEPDRESNGAKLAIDLLQPTRGDAPGLGLIRDDSPRSADVRQWWEHLPRRLGRGFVLLEVRTGDPEILAEAASSK